MADPRVESLIYRLEVGESLTFNNPPPLDHETQHFAARLDAGTLTVTMQEHHAEIPSARQRVETFLLSWEVEADLVYGPGTLRFVYQDANVIDRAGNATILQPDRCRLSMTGQPVKLVHGRAAYLPPPTDFVASPDVLTLWNRFQGYLENREPLTAMAYFCFTLLTARGHGREGAAAMYAVERKVLKKLSELTSVRGDEATGRKFLPNPQPLTEAEARWVGDVVRALIRRAGEVAAGKTPLSRLAMTDFPPLK